MNNIIVIEKYYNGGNIKMAKRLYKKQVENTLTRLGLCKEAILYLSLGVEYCVKHDIDPLDIKLTQHLYPTVLNVYGLEPKTTEARIRRSISESYKDNKTTSFYDELGYNGRPTIKTLLLLLIQEVVN